MHKSLSIFITTMSPLCTRGVLKIFLTHNQVYGINSNKSFDFNVGYIDDPLHLQKKSNDHPIVKPKATNGICFK